MISCCPPEVHAAMKSSVHVFFERTVPLQWAPDPVDGQQYRNCTECRSTLTLPQCARCFELCPSTDVVAAGGQELHCRCLVERMASRGEIRFSPWRYTGTARSFLNA